VGRAEALLERRLLAEKVLLGCVGDWHIASVYGEPRDAPSGRHVVVRRSRVPCQ
jgi:hypothetical protein